MESHVIFLGTLLFFSFCFFFMFAHISEEDKALARRPMGTSTPTKKNTFKSGYYLYDLQSDSFYYYLAIGASNRIDTSDLHPDAYPNMIWVDYDTLHKWNSRSEVEEDLHEHMRRFDIGESTHNVIKLMSICSQVDALDATFVYAEYDESTEQVNVDWTRAITPDWLVE